MVLKAMIVTTALLISFGAVLAAPITDIAPNGDKYTLPIGAENQRVGNGVLTVIRFANAGNTSSGAQQLLAACDGSWYAVLDLSWDFKGVTIISFSTEMPLDAIQITQTAGSNDYYASILKKYSAQLCKSAGAEPRNFVLPLTVSATDSKEKATSSALLLGTRTKSAGTIDVWMRQSDFRYKPRLDANGNPVIFSGVAQKDKEATGDYKIVRSAFNCRDRTMATYHSVSYVGNSPPQEASIPRDKVELSSVVPGSVGEGQLEVICKIYSGAGAG